MAVCFPVASYGQSCIVYRSCGSHSSWKAFRELQFSAAILKTDSKFPQAKNPGPALLSIIDVYFALVFCVQGPLSFGNHKMGDIKALSRAKPSVRTKKTGKYTWVANIYFMSHISK